MNTFFDVAIEPTESAYDFMTSPVGLLIACSLIAIGIVAIVLNGKKKNEK